MDRIKDAVQPPRWFDALPRPCFKCLRAVPQTQPWFEVYALGADVYAIYEPGHFQEVISYLILGGDKALLFDTGMGIGNMKKLAGELTSLPLVVLNSHTHFDHIGCNWRFDGVHVFDHPVSLGRLAHGLSGPPVLRQLEGEATCAPYPEGFDPSAYAISPSHAIPVRDGHVFGLGGRTLTVLHTPGHSPDSIMLRDSLTDALFTGDTFYPAVLYLHLTSPDGMCSDFEVFRETMRRLSALEGVTSLYTSHNEPVVDAGALSRVYAACESIASGADPDEADDSGLKKYVYDGFAIVTK